MPGKKIFSFVALFLTCFVQANTNNLPTQFPYSSHRLQQMNSTFSISEKRMGWWEQPLLNYFHSNQVPYLTQVRFYTYLYMAQRDAAFLSYNVKQCFMGSLDPLTEQVVLTFFPNFTDLPPLDTDSYSEELARIVWTPYQQRLDTEQANSRTFSRCDGHPIPPIVQAVAKWIPWNAALPQSTPPRKSLAGQIKSMKAVQNQESSPLKEDHWRILANQYMQENQTDLGKALHVRSALMRGTYDTLIAIYHAKYAYGVPRPWEVDPTCQPSAPKEASPSYPSTTAGIAAASEVILSRFLPENQTEWMHMADEDVQSSVVCGVHTSQDVSEGRKLGMGVGHMICEQMGNQSLPTN